MNIIFTENNLSNIFLIYQKKFLFNSPLKNKELSPNEFGKFSQNAIFKNKLSNSVKFLIYKRNFS